MGSPPQARPPQRMHLNGNHMVGTRRAADLKKAAGTVTGSLRSDEALSLRGSYCSGSLPEHGAEASREVYHYGQALQAKKLTGEVIQPTAMHATAFANKPLFMAIDRQMEISQSMEKLHELATQHVAMARDQMESRKRERELAERRQVDQDVRSETPVSKSISPSSQDLSESDKSEKSDKAEETKEEAPRMADTPFVNEATESHGRITSEPTIISTSEDDEDEDEEPPAKRSRQEPVENELSQDEVIRCFLDSNRELLAEFKESNSVLLQHLQYQRQADDSFRRELMDMERERARSERETLSVIAQAILGSSRLAAPRPADPMQNLQDAAASFARYSSTNSQPSSSSNPYSNFPLGALAHSMMMSGSWPPPPGREATR